MRTRTVLFLYAEHRELKKLCQNQIPVPMILQRHKYNGKELDRMHGLNLLDYGARWYDPLLCRFTTMDPLCEKYYDISPYAYCANNPVNAVDPDGRSTWVTHQGNGQYRIFGGSISDNDRNIYLYGHNEDGRFTRLKSIGESALTTSFYDSDNKTWAVGSTISLTDESGKAFLSQVASLEITLNNYLNKARTNHPYDFKVTNGTGKVVESSRKYVFRGMPIGKTGSGMTLFASGKDVGNMAAGIVAAKNGITWPMARMAFDAYQSVNENKPSAEGVTTRNAEYYGWSKMYQYSNTHSELKNLFEMLKSLF